MTTPHVISIMELETIERSDGSLIRPCLSLLFYAGLNSDKSAVRYGQDRISPYKHLSIRHGQAKFFAHPRHLIRSIYRQRILSRRQIFLQTRQVDGTCFCSRRLPSINIDRSYTICPRTSWSRIHFWDQISTPVKCISFFIFTKKEKKFNKSISDRFRNRCPPFLRIRQPCVIYCKRRNIWTLS
jgi:hypothetical protein